MKGFSSLLGIAVLTSLPIAPPSLAQHDAHEGYRRPASEPRSGTDMSSPPVPLARLLQASDRSLRSMERAIERDDPESFVDSMADYLGAVERVESHFESPGDDVARLQRELSRAERALGRQHESLTRMSSDSPNEFQEGLRTALDACLRAWDAVAADASGLAGRGAAQDDGHHRGREWPRGGCGGVVHH